MAISKDRKTAIRDVIVELTKSRDELKAQNLAIKTQVETQVTELENQKEELDEEYEDMSESQQESDAGQALHSLIDDLESAIEYANSIPDELDKDHFEEIISHLESVIK